jgi:alpha-N-arabinofuranosidase
MNQHLSWRSYLTVLTCLMVASFIVCPPGHSQETPQGTAPGKPAVAEVSVDASKVREPISPYIYGQFIEHLGRCIYGGIWAEMLEDRKFYFLIPADKEIWRLTREQARVLAASPWKVIGPQGTVEMVKQNAFVGDHIPQITAPGDGTAVGIYQEELGLVKGRAYVGYLYVAAEGTVAPVTVSLSWGQGDTDKAVHPIKSVGAKYTKVSFRFTAGADSDNGRLAITTDGKGKLKIGCVSLMPADNVEGFRQDTLELLRQLNAPVYRWPGGNFVSGYDWRDGLGDRDRRPTRTNPAWTGIETNDMGMHEFVRLCELIEAEPMIAVNTGFGDAYSAAAEVEYANGSTKTPMGKLRAQNGSSKPFGVKWWCVGNEMWGNWQLGYMQLRHYVLKHNWVEEKMRQVDPTIKTVGSGEVGNAGERSWTRGMLTSCADHMDLISEHFYCRSREDIPQHVAQIPSNVKRIADAHRKLRQELPSLKGKDIRIALDEWNYWYGPHVFGELGTRYFLKDALGIAAGLHEYFRNSDIIFMANYAQTVNVIGCIKTTKTAAEFDSTALPLTLYRRHFGTIPVAVEHHAAPLDVSAALTPDKKALTVAVVNPTKDTAQLKLNLGSVKLTGQAQTWIIAGDDPMAYNQPGEPRKVDILEAGATDLAGVVSVKPLSITLWKVAIQ